MVVVLEVEVVVVVVVEVVVLQTSATTPLVASPSNQEHFVRAHPTRRPKPSLKEMEMAFCPWKGL